MTASAYRFLPDNPIAPLSMPRSQTVLIDPAGRDQATVLEVIEGVCRVYCPCEETEGMTLAFLQSGDRLRTDRLCSDCLLYTSPSPRDVEESRMPSSA